MAGYLSYQQNYTAGFVDALDDMSLWSAPFGLLLLEYLELKENISVIDIGSGAGFPLLELAGRLGESCKLYGIDPYAHANQRARKKIAAYGLSNVKIIEQSAESLPFGDQEIDLAISNLGINNVDNAAQVFNECHRVLKPGGKLALTTNLNGHWQQFYRVFEATLIELGYPDFVAGLKEEENHRGSKDTVAGLFTNAGFKVSRQHEKLLEMKFLNGSAFLNHHFIKYGWLSAWRSLAPPDQLIKTFTLLEHNLNEYAAANSGLNLTVPMLFMEGERI